jgi:dTDP-4-dehydrorhamnose 3,5-epimerase
MKLNKPIVFKKIFSKFDDDRGFLSTLDIKNLYQNLPDQNFNLTYQLISYSAKKNTFRGMHYQTKPYSQNKLIVLHAGSIIDLAVDVNNANIDQVLRFEMSAGDAILIPENYAHGFISLTDEVLLQYFMDNEYSKENYKGLNLKKYLEREFPKLDLIVSDKDKNISNFIL